MTYRKKTLRKIPETSRKLARLINNLESNTVKLKNLLPEIVTLEHDSIALGNANRMAEALNKATPASTEELFPAESPTAPVDQASIDLAKARQLDRAPDSLMP